MVHLCQCVRQSRAGLASHPIQRQILLAEEFDALKLGLCSAAEWMHECLVLINLTAIFILCNVSLGLLKNLSPSRKFQRVVRTAPQSFRHAYKMS